jgi:hypothetical protein
MRWPLRQGPADRHTVYAFGSPADSARRAFVISARNIIDMAGRRVPGLDRLHLTADVPTMVVWAVGIPSSRSITPGRRRRGCRAAALSSSSTPRTSPLRGAGPVRRRAAGLPAYHPLRGLGCRDGRGPGRRPSRVGRPLNRGVPGPGRLLATPLDGSKSPFARGSGPCSIALGT